MPQTREKDGRRYRDLVLGKHETPDTEGLINRFNI